MRNFCLIVLFILLSNTTPAQTGYKDKDTVKYTKTVIVTNSINFKTLAYYKGDEIRKITREFIGSGFSSTTIYYISNGLLTESVYVALRQPKGYFEEHNYFVNNKMVKWENTDDQIIDSTLSVFSDKEKLTLKFFEDDLKEAKTKKAVR